MSLALPPWRGGSFDPRAFALLKELP